MVQHLPRSCIQHVECAIVAGHGHALAVGRESATSDPARMIHRHQRPFRLEVPDHEFARARMRTEVVDSRRHQPLAVHGEGDRENVGLVAQEAVARFPRRCVPEADGSQSAGDEGLAVGRDREGVDLSSMAEADGSQSLNGSWRQRVAEQVRALYSVSTALGRCCFRRRC